MYVKRLGVCNFVIFSGSEVIVVCMCLRFALHSSGVMFGSEMIMFVRSLLWNIVAFMFLSGCECMLR